VLRTALCQARHRSRRGCGWCSSWLGVVQNRYSFSRAGNRRMNETDKGGQAGAATGCSAAEIGYRHVFPQRLIVMRGGGGMACAW
jgi:hypothetical protein